MQGTEKFVKENPRITAIMGVAFLLFAWFVYVEVKRAIKKGKEQPSNNGGGSTNTTRPNVPDVPVQNPATPNHVKSIASTLSIELHKKYAPACHFMLFGGTGQRCQVMERALKLSDEDFKHLANYYKNNNNNTLKQDLLNIECGCYNGGQETWLGGGKNEPKPLLIKRLEDLGIS